MHRIFILASFCLGCSILYAQEYPRINITVEDGLPSNTIYDVFQDSRGFVWVATENGLARFNGASFKSIQVKNLKSLAVADIVEDNQGTIWCINFSGQVLRIMQDTLTPLPHWEALKKSGFPKLMTIEGQVFILKQQFHRFDSDQDTLISYLGSREDFIRVARGTQEIWADFENSITRVHPDHSASPVKIQIPKALELPGSPAIATLGKQRVLLSFVEKNIYRFTLNGELEDITERFHELNVNFRMVRKLDANRVVFYGSNGLVIIDSSLNMQHLLPGANVGSVTLLTEGGLLVGTLNKGLYLIPSLKSKYRLASTGQGFSELAYDRANDRIIAGDLGGSVLFHNRALQEMQVVDATSSTAAIQSMLIDYRRNRMLAQSNRMLMIDLNQMKTLESKAIQTVKSMKKIKDRYYLASSFGLLELNEDMDLTRKYIEDTRMSSMMPLSDSLLVLGTQRGTLVFNTGTNRESTSSYPFQSDFSNLTCAASHKDLYLMGSATEGIRIYNKQLELVRKLSTENGLVSNQINALSCEGSRLAVGTNNGVSLVDLTTWQVQNLDRSDGLHGQEVADVMVLGDSLIVATTALQYFELPLSQNKVRPEVHIDELEIDKGAVEQQKNGFFIPYGATETVIHFDVSNSIQDLGKTRIYYRLLELQSNTWNELSMQSAQARFLSLPSGEYTLQAFAKNSKDQISERIQLPIIIETPFWKTNGFLFLLFLLCAMTIGYLVYLYYRRINRKKQSELIRSNRAQQLRIAQLTSIRAQMNPHFIFNTMTMIQGLVLNGESKPAGKTIQDFSKLMRSVLELSSEEFITLDAELKIIERYLEIEKRRFDGHLNYEIDLDPEIIAESIRIPSLLTQPYVENALRHGLLHKEGEKRLILAIQIEDNFLSIVIEDNGIGRKAATALRQKQLGKSFALEAYQKRIELLNETSDNKIEYTVMDLHFESQQAAGTRVTLKVPLNYGR